MDDEGSGTRVDDRNGTDGLPFVPDYRINSTMPEFKDLDSRGAEGINANPPDPRASSP